MKLTKFLVMTIQEKELLLQDLCARLLYYTKADDRGEFFTIRAYHPSGAFIDDFGITHCTDNIKPYLFPLSSMTEEQKIEINKITNGSVAISKDFFYDLCNCSKIYHFDVIAVIDWLNKNHFDYRDLIEMIFI